MKPDLTDARIVVTAGCGGIGRAIADAYANAGARVAVCDVDAKLVAASPHIASLCDVSDEAQVAEFFGRALNDLGGIDVLVNNAGIAGPTLPVEQMPLADWNQTLAVNLTGQFLCARAVIPAMKAQSSGAIINLSSTAGRLGMPLRSAYSASKYGVRGLTDVLAIELGAYGIRVNAILPGLVAGPRLDQVVAQQAAARGMTKEDYLPLMLHNVSMHSTVTAGDVAAMALFLGSPAARHVSGQSISVCGNFESYRAPFVAMERPDA
jgi:NAD(P)-dependent dehydrogenase (short-subunit alcohol dehydrogenase family)